MKIFLVHAVLATLAGWLPAQGTARPAAPARSPLPLTVAELDAAADVILENLVPREDTPIAIARRLVDMAFKLRRSEFATILLAQSEPNWSLESDPQRTLRDLLRFDDATCTGEVLHETLVQRRALLQRLGTFTHEEAEKTFAGYASSFTVLGPFGDGGDFYTGIQFPPEKTFPGPDEVLDGRFGKIRSRAVERNWDRYRISLWDPRNRHAGCYYALHQTTTTRATACYLRIWCQGSIEVFVNGVSIYLVDHATDESPPLHRVPARLRAGHNHVLIKTSDNRTSGLGLRYQSRDGRTLQGITEWTKAPAVKPFETAATGLQLFPKIPGPADLLSDAADQATGPIADRLRMAAALCANGPRHSLELLDSSWHTPPPAPRLRLTLATMLRGHPLLPETIRRSQARRLEEGLTETLTNHHTMSMRRVDHLVAEDRREDALRLLRKIAAAKAGRPGPEVFRRMTELCSALGLQAERRRQRAAWRTVHPSDPRPALAEARFLKTAGDVRGALGVLQQMASHHPGDRRMLSDQFALLLDLGDRVRAQAVVDRLYSHEHDELPRIRMSAVLAKRAGDLDGFLDLQEKIAGHPTISTAELSSAADALRRGGRAAVANRLDREVLARAPDYHEVRRRLAEVGGGKEFPNILRFRRQSQDVIEGFELTAREAGASSSLLLDQMIIEVFEDGSHVDETHTIRRINDHTGVEQFKNASGAANAEEVVLVRTIATDGKSYVPNRVAGKFSMPRLTPGAMLEQVYRNYHSGAAPDPWRITKFYFQSADAPFLLSELVLILPPDHAGTFRRRNLPAPREILLEDGKTAFVFRVENSPRLPTDPHRPPIEEIAPVVAYGQDDTIDEVARDLRRNAHRRCIVTPLIRRQAKALVAGKSTDTEKLAAIHSFVHDQIVAARGSANPTSILMLKKGPRFFLEAALIKAAGIPFRHALCARSRRALRPLPRPFYAEQVPYQVACMLVQPRGGEPVWLFVDSPRHYPLGEMRADRVGAEVILTDPREDRLLPMIPWQSRSGLSATGTMQLDAQGNAELDIEITIRGADGYSLAESIREQPRTVQMRIARNLIGQMMPGWTFVSASPVNLKEYVPLRVRGVLRRRGALDSAGDKSLLGLPMPAMQLLGAFGGRVERSLPMRLTRQLARDWRIRIEPAAEFEVRELPVTVKTTEELISFELAYARAGRSIVVTRKVEQRPGEIALADFGKWRALLERLDAAETVKLELFPKRK